MIRENHEFLYFRWNFLVNLRMAANPNGSLLILWFGCLQPRPKCKKCRSQTFGTTPETACILSKNVFTKFLAYRKTYQVKLKFQKMVRENHVFSYFGWIFLRNII